MDLFNKLATNLGNPILAVVVVLVGGRYFFKEKKPIYALGVLLGGGIVYYIMHNISTVFQSFGTVARAIIDFFVSLF
ncbi:TcpD family membrane protein [Streptococcus sp. S784/96/1]|uniref:TcpD family membrane protein n=1 Tax=Streptococcus sp. S784/96/1 TaxID=2653499 RepID=UPI0013868A6E|nr:TcpD family membrane protein [Streptococcus sp. S784/96/1]